MVVYGLGMDVIVVAVVIGLVFVVAPALIGLGTVVFVVAVLIGWEVVVFVGVAALIGWVIVVVIGLVIDLFDFPMVIDKVVRWLLVEKVGVDNVYCLLGFVYFEHCAYEMVFVWCFVNLLENWLEEVGME